MENYSDEIYQKETEKAENYWKMRARKIGMPNRLRKVEFNCIDKHDFCAKATKRCEKKAAKKYRHFSRGWAGSYSIMIWKLEL